MKNKSLVLIGLLLAAGPALAQEYAFPTIQVRAHADDTAALSFDCVSPREPNLTDVESVLGINDPKQTKGLSEKLKVAVAEACAAGVPFIVVQRGKDGQSLTWSAYNDSQPNTVQR